MKYSKFPRSGEPISRLGFGAMGFAGWFGEDTEDNFIAALHRALELGINFVDTARQYGQSERIVGLALRRWTGRKPFVATKVQALGPNSQWQFPVEVETAFPPGHITADCERSLRELGLDQLDLLQLHIYWPTWGTSGYWMDELQELKRRGKVRFVGISVPDHRSDMVLGLVESGLIDSVQTILNIFDPLALDNLVPICAKRGVAVIARSVLDEGGLTGLLTSDTRFEESDFRHNYFDRVVPREVYLRKVDSLRLYVPAHASSLASLALRFVLANSRVTTAIVSMQVEAYAEMNIAALDEPELPAELVHRLRTRHRFIKNFNRVQEWED
jgi:aryl-alcohol dehydrogenase-like predicted oxidoreductase